MKAKALFLCGVLMMAWLGTARAEGWNLVLLVTSDMEGQLEPFEIKTQEKNQVVIQEVGGFGRLAAAMARLKDKYAGQVLTLSSGDDLMGPFFNRFHGEPIYKAMNTIGYDVGTMGNHEFDYGDAFLAESLKHCRFPLVETNLTIGEDSPLYGRFPKIIVKKINGLKVGFFGLINEDLSLITKPGPHVAVNPDFIGVARDAVAVLKKDHGVDLIVVLAHIGLNWSLELAQRVPAIDVVCVGNAVTLVERGRELVRHEDGRRTVVIQPGEKGEYLGVLKLHVADRRVIDYHWQPIRLDSRIPEDQDMKAFVASYRKQLPEDSVLTRSTVPIDTRKKTLRSGEAPIGSLVADIIRRRFVTRISFYNGGGIRGNKVLPAGDIRTSDLVAMFPFGDHVYIGKILGRVILQALERGVAQLPEAKGPFLQVSGLRYTINPSARPQELSVNPGGKVTGLARSGERILDVEVQEEDGTYQPLVPDRYYTVTTTGFLANGGDGYCMLKNTPGWRNTDTLVRAVVEEGLGAEASISPRVFDRIRFSRP